jgi:Fe-S-cluster containining protein
MGRSNHPKSVQHITECQRCGTCCRKGGPTLHIEDKPLVERGAIPLRDLLTIRRGEWVHENVQGDLRTTDAELIRLKGTTQSWTCAYFDPDGARCHIYWDRPIECRAMQCWDTQKIEAVYPHNRLTRRDLLGDVAGLWDLVADHEARCGYDRVGELTQQMRRQPSKAVETQLSRIISYDREIRRLLVEQGLDAAMLDLFLGRPLTKTLEMFGFKVVQESGRLIIKRCPLPLRPLDF